MIFAHFLYLCEGTAIHHYYLFHKSSHWHSQQQLWCTCDSRYLYYLRASPTFLFFVLQIFSRARCRLIQLELSLERAVSTLEGSLSTSNWFSDSKVVCLFLATLAFYVFMSSFVARDLRWCALRKNHHLFLKSSSWFLIPSFSSAVAGLLGSVYFAHAWLGSGVGFSDWPCAEVGSCLWVCDQTSSCPLPPRRIHCFIQDLNCYHSSPPPTWSLTCSSPTTTHWVGFHCCAEFLLGSLTMTPRLFGSSAGRYQSWRWRCLFAYWLRKRKGLSWLFLAFLQ